MNKPTQQQFEKSLNLINDDLICDGSPIIYRQAKWLAQALQEVITKCDSLVKQDLRIYDHSEIQGQMGRKELSEEILSLLDKD